MIVATWPVFTHSFSLYLSFSFYFFLSLSFSLALYLSLSLSLSISLFLLFVFCLVHTLYTLSANAAGNRTLCDLCQAKYQRKQTRHRDRRTVEHDAAEELDGTREHRKREQLSCRPDFFFYRSTDLEYVLDSSSRYSSPYMHHPAHEHHSH